MTRKHLVRLAAYLRRMWRDFDCANRRVFELRTGVPAPRRRMTVAELEALYAAS